MERSKSCWKFFIVNRRMLPIKLHFFFYSIALSSAIAYFPILGKNIGFSATALSIIFTVSTFSSILTNPVFGWITDKLQKITVVIICMILIQTPFLIGAAYLPPLETETLLTSAELKCSSDNSYIMTLPNTSIPLANNTNLNCTSNCFLCPGSAGSGIIGSVASCSMDIILENHEFINESPDSLKIANIFVKGISLVTSCEEEENRTCQVSCLNGEAETKNEFASYQFWTIFVLIFWSTVLTNAILGLGDAACCEALEGRLEQFGRQKVWLTIGWGVGTAAAGGLLDLTMSFNGGKVDYRYTACLVLILMVFDIAALIRTKLKKPKASKHIFKDIGKVFARIHTIFFFVATFVVGFCSGIQRTFQFWYLEEMGASKFLIGFSDGVSCILVEAPFMIISGWIIQKTGRDNCVVLALSAYAFWLLAASLIYNPWWIILINISEGPAIALFGVVVSSYGKTVSASGTEATMQTILEATLHGVGLGSGGLIGGIGYDLYGGRNTYRYSGFFAVVAALIYKLLTHFVAGENTVIQAPKEKLEKELDNEELTNGAFHLSSQPPKEVITKGIPEIQKLCDFK